MTEWNTQIKSLGGDISFSLIGTYDGSEVASTVFEVSIKKNNYVYLGDTNGGLWIADVTDESNPVFVSYTPAGDWSNGGVALIMGLAISDDGNILYFSGNQEESEDAIITIVDITNKASPNLTVLGTTEIGDLTSSTCTFFNTNQTIFLTDSSTLAVLVSSEIEGTNNTVFFINVSNPASLSIYDGSIFKTGTSEVEKMITSGIDLYVAIYNSSGSGSTYIEKYDVSNPDSPSLSNTSDTTTHIDSVEALTVDSDERVFEIIVDNTHKLISYSNDFSSSSVLVTTIDETHGIGQIAVSNNLLISVDLALGSTYMFDVSDIENVTELQIDSQDGNSVTFDYPYFYTTNTGDNTMFVWLIDAGTDWTNQDKNTNDWSNQIKS